MAPFLRTFTTSCWGFCPKFFSPPMSLSDNIFNCNIQSCTSMAGYNRNRLFWLVISRFLESPCSFISCQRTMSCVVVILDVIFPNHSASISGRNVCEPMDRNCRLSICVALCKPVRYIYKSDLTLFFSYVWSFLLGVTLGFGAIALRLGSGSHTEFLFACL